LCLAEFNQICSSFNGFGLNLTVLFRFWGHVTLSLVGFANSYRCPSARYGMSRPRFGSPLPSKRGN
jgi:hypothetical protein